MKIWFQNRRSKCKKIAKQAQRDNDGQIISPTNSVGGVNAASPPSSTPSPMVMSQLTSSQMNSGHGNQYGQVVAGNGEMGSQQQQQGQQIASSDASSISSQINEGTNMMALVENGAAQNIHFSTANDPGKPVASPSSSKGSHHQMTPSPTDRSRIALPTLERVNGNLQQQQRTLANNCFVNSCIMTQSEQQMGIHQESSVANPVIHDQQQMQMQIGGLPIKTEMFQSPMTTMTNNNHYNIPQINSGSDNGMYDINMTSQQQMYVGHPPHLQNPTSCFPSVANQMMQMSSSQYINPYMNVEDASAMPSSVENSYAPIQNGSTDNSMAIAPCNDVGMHENGRYLK